MGTETTYLQRTTGTDSHYFAQSLGTSREANEDLQVVCDALNEVEALRESYSELLAMLEIWLPTAIPFPFSESDKVCASRNREWRRARELLGRAPIPHPTHQNPNNGLLAPLQPL